MLGRYGDINDQPQGLLDRRQVAAMAISLLALFAGVILDYALRIPGWPSLLYAVGIVLLGTPIIVSAAKGVLAGHTNVDELVALALLASIAGGYLLEADVVAILMVAGSMFEQRASLRARRAIAQLLALAPQEATLLHPDGGEEKVHADQLRQDHRILVRPGQRIAADGIIEEGASTIDQSAVTGESVPVFRQKGESVFAGSLAVDGSLTLRVTRAGMDSTVGQIVRIVQEAEQYQAPAMRIADRWARYYTPIILAIALLTLVGSRVIHAADPTPWKLAWSRAVAVLVVGCPCTIVLATPTAIIAAMGRSARLGLLIKHGGILERASQVNCIIFDKTGTLTTGRHHVAAVVPADDLDGRDQIIGLCPALSHSILALHTGGSGETAGGGTTAVLEPSEEDTHKNARETKVNTLLSLAASIEYHSNHPFARAIREHAQHAGIDVEPATDSRELPGLGVCGRVRGQPVMVGKPQFIAQRIRNACAVPGTPLRPLEGHSAVAVEVAGTYAGLILLRDTLRAEAEPLVKELRESGITDLAVLSGDQSGAVRLVADQLHLDHAFSGLLPAEKARRVKELRDQGRSVAFIGDGMNDAPALAMADVAIAMGGTGTDLALQTADVVLLNDRIDLLGTFFRLARKVRTIIYGNLFFGLALNVVAIVLASSGILSPIMGALVHNLGSAFVVGNSARLAAFPASRQRP